MNKTNISKVIAAIFTVALLTIPAMTFAQDSGLDVGGGGINGADTNTSTGANLTVGGDSQTGADAGMSVGGSNINGADTNTSNSSGSGLIVGGGNTNGADGTSNPVTPPGGSSSSGGSITSSGSSGGTPVLFTLNNAGILVNTDISSCPLITSNILKNGLANSQLQVAKLQAFLKNSEGINVAVTGVFNAETEAAVIAFQKKYTESILLPWGGPKASGIAYITTIKKINEIACKKPLTLSARELAIISAYRDGATTSSAGSVQDVVSGQTDFGTSTITDAMNGSTTSNTSAVANTSLAARLWNFLVNLFR